VANRKHFEILNKGAEAWNEWRRQNPKIRPNLAKEILLLNVDLSGADLSGADLSGTDLFGARLDRADLRGADLHEAGLGTATLFAANLNGANLTAAALGGANFNMASLSGMNVTNSVMAGTVLANVDLSSAKGLETVKHRGPSTVGIDTIYKSKGKIPEMFLRGAGVPEIFIAYMKSLAGSPTVFEYYSSFISYSTKDQKFADLLHWQLQSKGARVWLATEDLKIGGRFRAEIDEAIRLYDKLLLVLSKDSVKSPWVEAEVEAAFEKERKQKRTVLFPIRLDDAVMETEEAWAADIRRTRHIGDFRKWKNHDEYQKAFGRLMRDLKAEEKGQN
jgi:hypothetical protein